MPETVIEVLSFLMSIIDWLGIKPVILAVFIVLAAIMVAQRIMALRD